MDQYKDDIQRYLSGEMTGAERNAFERKALSDPFLQEALEGAAKFPEDFELDAESLEDEILARARPASRWSWRIAAGVALVLATAGLWYYTSDAPPEPLASQTTPAEVSGDSIAADAVDTSSLNKPLLALQQPAARFTPTPVVPPQQEVLREDPQAIQLSPSGAGAVRDSVKVADQVAELAEEEAKVATEEKQRAVVSQQSLRKAEAVREVVRGRVVDEQGQPLPGVTVLVQNATAGTVTDGEGNYSLQVTNPQQVLVYSFVGFERQEKRASDAQGVVQMKEDVAQLSEVVVTGHASDEDPDHEPVIKLAEPVGGIRAYNKYLEKNKQYPAAAMESKIEGRVTLEFTVDVMGAVSEFTVVKSVGYGCDEEVMRLVKEGPRWNPTRVDDTAVESVVRVRLKFSLPKKK